MTEDRNAGKPSWRIRRDRLWFRRVFTIAGAGVLVWLYFETLSVASRNAGTMESVLLALVAGISAITGYYVKRRSDSEKGGFE